MALEWPEDIYTAVAELHDEDNDVDYILYAVSDAKKPTPKMILHSKGKGGREKVAEILSSSECDDKVITGAFMASAVDERGDIVSIRRKFVRVTFVGGSVGALVKGKVNSWSGNFRDQFGNMTIDLQLDYDRMDELDEKTLEASLIASSGGDKPTKIDFSNGGRTEMRGDNALKDRVSALKEASSPKFSKKIMSDTKEEMMGSSALSINGRVSAWLDVSHNLKGSVPPRLPLTIDETMDSVPMEEAALGEGKRQEEEDMGWTEVDMNEDDSIQEGEKIEKGEIIPEQKEEPGSFEDRMKVYRENTAPDAFAKKNYDNPNKIASVELAQCHMAKENAKERWGKFQGTGKQQKQEADTEPEPEPELAPDEACLSPSKLKNASWIIRNEKNVAQKGVPVASDELAQCHEARERWGKTPEQRVITTTRPSDMPMLEKDMLKDRMSAFGGGKVRNAIIVSQKGAKGRVDSTSPPCKQPQDPTAILPGMWPDDVSTAVKELQDDHTIVDYILYAVSDPKKPSPEMVLHSKGKGGREKMAEILSSSECDDKVITGAFMASAVDERGDIVSIRRKFVHVTFVGGSVGALVKGKVNSWSGNFRDPFPNMSVYLQLNADRMDELDEKTLEASLIASSGGNKPSRIDFTNGDRNERDGDNALKDRVSALKEASSPKSSRIKSIDAKEEIMRSPGSSINDLLSILRVAGESTVGLPHHLSLTIDEMKGRKPAKDEVLKKTADFSGIDSSVARIEQ